MARSLYEQIGLRNAASRFQVEQRLSEIDQGDRPDIDLPASSLDRVRSILTAPTDKNVYDLILAGLSRDDGMLPRQRSDECRPDLERISERVGLNVERVGPGLFRVGSHDHPADTQDRQLPGREVIFRGVPFRFSCPGFHVVSDELRQNLLLQAGTAEGPVRFNVADVPGYSVPIRGGESGRILLVESRIADRSPAEIAYATDRGTTGALALGALALFGRSREDAARRFGVRNHSRRVADLIADFYQRAAAVFTTLCDELDSEAISDRLREFSVLYRRGFARGMIPTLK